MAKKEPKLTGSAKPDISEDSAKSKRWEVISEEYVIDEDGNRKLSKEVYQLRREFLLKIISSSAVIIAFAGLVLNLWYQRKQNDFQIAQQRALGQFANFNPMDKLLEVIEENKKLYERLLQAEREKIELLKK
jgi:hypothetical protein